MAVRDAQQKIADNPVFLYTKRGCSVCTDMKRYLDKEYGRNKCKVEELDKLPGMEQTAIEEFLDANHGGHTLPRLFIRGKCLGSPDDLEKLKRSGELKELLLEAKK